MVRAGEWYYITPGGYLYLWNRQSDVSGSQLVAKLDRAFYDDPSLLHDALNPEIATLASVYDATLGLELAGSYYENWGGLGEKWISSSDGIWYFITADGGFYRWNGQQDLRTSKKIAQFNSFYHADPSKLHDALFSGGAAGGPSVAVNGTQLVVDVPPGYIGELRIRLTINNGVQQVVDVITVDVRP